MIQLNLTQKPGLKTKLRINNKVILSIKMLQMSYEELQSFIKSEAEKTPLITLNQNTFTQNEENYREEYEINIKNWLYQQSSIIAKNSIEKEIIEIFIENLDDNGFCKISTLEVSKLSKSS